MVNDILDAGKSTEQKLAEIDARERRARASMTHPKFRRVAQMTIEACARERERLRITDHGADVFAQ